jgi:hypothetical protein
MTKSINVYACYCLQFGRRWRPNCLDDFIVANHVVRQQAIFRVRIVQFQIGRHWLPN